MNRTASALLMLFSVAACARSEDASLVQPDGEEGYNRIEKVGTPEADDREPAIGQWRASLQENVQVLEFGPMGTEPLFSMACTGNRSVLLQRHGGAPSGPLPAMQIAKGEVAERFNVSLGGGTVPMLRAELSLQSPLAEALAAEGEPMLVTLGDSAPLVLPPNGLIGDYLSSCASARPQVAGTNSAAPAPAPLNVTAPANSASPAPSTNAATPQ